jgi:hypothetical protein
MRSCRSVALKHSNPVGHHLNSVIDAVLPSIYFQAQLNITELNIDIWGTCNTPVDADQCAANMKWFTSELLDACSQEKSENSQVVLQSLAGTFLFDV